MIVSVVVPTYRRTKSLELAVESVINQTHKEIELIVVDDNADAEWNNATEILLRRYQQIKYIRNTDNYGSAESRNIGIRAAKGEYITFLDDDDVYLPQKVEYQISAMISVNADYSVTDLNLYSENGRLIDKRVRSYIKETDRTSLISYHLAHHITGTDTMMFRRSYLLKIGGFPRINAGDEFYLMERAISGGGKFLYIPGCYIKAYVHTRTDGISSGESKINGENQLYAYKKKFFAGLSKRTRRQINMRHYAVIAFAELRRKNYACFLVNSLRSFFESPIECVLLLFGHGR